MKRTAWLVNSFLVLIVLMTSNAKAVMASPHFSLSPSSGNYSVNDTFSVTVNVDSASKVVGGLDVVGTYDSSKLELTSVVESTDMVFKNMDGGGSCTIRNDVAGRYSASCNSNFGYDNTAVNGPLVVLNFKAKAVGTAPVGYTCTNGSTADSNIIETSTANDLIVCGENVGGSYTIGESDGTDPTSAPTGTSSTLPNTGSVGVTLGLVAFGVITMLSAAFLKFL